MSFDVRFVIDGAPKLVLTDTTVHSGLSDFYGFFRVQYPDGIVVENEVPDFGLDNRIKILPLRTTKKGLIHGTYIVTQKSFVDGEEEEDVKVFDFEWVEPSLLLKDNSSIALPSVSFLDITNYQSEGYNHAVSRQITSKFPVNTIDVELSLPAIELFMIHEGNTYEGIYKPKLSANVVYTSAFHSVEWVKEKEFVFDIRSFIGFSKIVELINQVKEKLDEKDNPVIRQQYLMVTSLYTHIIAKLGAGEMDVVDLVAEMQEIAYNLSCSCCPAGYKYSLLPLPPYDPENFFGGFPFIDQVIYREWHEEINFSQTSTIFHRVEGRIKWYKSKSNNNIGNPIFIDGELNTDYWEPINDCCDFVTFRKEFVYEGGPQEFNLDYAPKTIILVSTDGYGVYHSSDYSLNENILTILPPNELAVGAEVIVVATYDGDDITNAPISGFYSVSDKDGNIQFNAEHNKNIRFEGDGGTEVDFDNVTHTVKISSKPSLIEGTYLEIKELKDNSQLIPKANYKITDYVTKHRIPSTNEVHTADIVEPLILTALSTNEFSIDVKSELYPHHEIEYRFDLNTCEGLSESRPGMITSRRDPYRRVYVGCDYLGVVTRLYKITGKVYREGIKVDDTNVTVTIPTNRPSLSNRTRYEVRFSDMVHPAGSITITLQYNNNTWIKPLVYHLDQEGGTIPANYLSEKTGTIIYNPTLDAFVLMGFVDTGANLIGTYSSTNPNGLSFSYGVSFTVDSNDYQDYNMFQDNYNEIHIPTNHLDLGTTNYYPNTVFKSYAWRFKVGSFLKDVVFNGGVSLFDIGDYIAGSIFESHQSEVKIHRYMTNTLYMTSISSHGYTRQEYYFVESCIICPVLNLQANVLGAVSLIFHRGSNFHATSIISDSNLFLDGYNVGVSVPNNFYITAPIYRSLIGYIDSKSWNINKTLNNETIFKRINVSNNGENLLGATKVDTLNIDFLQTPTGEITPLGIDEEGKTVSYEVVIPPSETTNLSDDDFYIGYAYETIEGVETRVEVINDKTDKDVIITDSGNIVINSNGEAKNFILTGEVNELRGIESATGGKEISLVNSTGKPVNIIQEYSGTPTNSQFSFGYTLDVNEKIYVKDNNSKWDLSPNNQVAFSDHLDSVNAQVSVGSDGLEYINGINNTTTGKSISLKEITATNSDVDQSSIFKVNNKFFAETRFWANRTIELSDYGVVGDGVADDTLKIQKAIDTLYRFGGGTLNFPAVGTFLVSHQGTKPYKSTLTGNAQAQRYCLMLKSGVVINLPEKATIKMADGQNAAIIINENFDYTDPRETSIGITGSGTLDSNRQNQGTLTSGGTNIAALSFQNVTGLQIGDLTFKDSSETSIKLNACDFVLGGKWRTTYSDGDAYRLGSWSPTQVFEGRVRFSNFDFLYAENCQNDVYNTIQGNPIVACITNSSFNTIHGRFCGGGFKYQEGCEYVTIKSAITEGAIGDDQTGSNAGNNSGFKIQGGTFLNNPPRHIAVGEVVSVNCHGDGLYLVYCDDVTVSSYIGVGNNRGAVRSCVRIQEANRVKVTSINSDRSGGLGVALRDGCYDTVFDQIIVTNPGEVTPLAGVQIVGGNHRIGSAIIRDNRAVKRMTYGLDIAGTGATGNINHLVTSGATINDIRDNTGGVFTIFRKETLTSDEFKMKYLKLDQLYVGNIDPSNDKLAIDVRSYSNYAIRAESYTEPGIRTQSNSSVGILGVSNSSAGGSFTSQTGAGVQGVSQSGAGVVGSSKIGRAGDFQQNQNPEATQSVPVIRAQRSWTGENNVTAALIYANDQVTTSGTRNNPLVDLRWDGITVFRIDNKGFIDVGNVRENRVESATNPTIVALDRNKYLRFTGSDGNINIPPDTFATDNELWGEIEGGAKTFVAGAGVTLRAPVGQGLLAPTGSRFIIKFKSPNDALVTIIKPYVSTGATTFPELTDTPSNYTGHKNKSVKVNNDETALVFVADGIEVRNITDGGSIAPTLTDGFIGSRLNFTSSTAVTLQGFTSAGGQSSATLVNPHATNDLTLVHNGAGTVKYIDAGSTDLVIAPKTAVKVEIVGNEIYRVL